MANRSGTNKRTKALLQAMIDEHGVDDVLKTMSSIVYDAGFERSDPIDDEKESNKVMRPYEKLSEELEKLSEKARGLDARSITAPSTFSDKIVRGYLRNPVTDAITHFHGPKRGQ